MNYLKLYLITVISEVLLCTIVSWTTLAVVLATTSTVFLYAKAKHSYWSTRKVPVPEFDPFLGHTLKMLSKKTPRWEFVDQAYHAHKSEGLWGLYEFFKPTLVVTDRDLLRRILVKDFDHFTDRRSFDLRGTRDEFVVRLLTMASGDLWRKLRRTVSPAFSTGKLRVTFDIIKAKCGVMTAWCAEEARLGHPVPLGETANRFAIDVIASAAFGIELESFEKSLEFQSRAKGVFPIARFSRILLFSLARFLFTTFSLRFTHPGVDFFVELAERTVRSRRASRESRGDFLDLLLEAERKEAASGRSDAVDGKTITAQVLLFLLAGFDTTANTLTFAVFLLCRHPRVQAKVRREVDRACGSATDIQASLLSEAEYLEAVILETLRLYPPTTYAERKCTKTYRMRVKDLTVEEGTVVSFPIWSLQRDPALWTDPEAFQPERFLNREGLLDPFAFLAFGSGPRSCIGKRFAMMEMKLFLATLVKKFEFRVPDDQNLELDPSPGILKPLTEIHCIFTEL